MVDYELYILGHVNYLYFAAETDDQAVADHTMRCSFSVFGITDRLQYHDPTDHQARPYYQYRHKAAAHIDAHGTAHTTTGYAPTPDSRRRHLAVGPALPVWRVITGKRL